MLQDSIIVFTSDNGGPAAGFNENAASNWPLRGVIVIQNYILMVGRTWCPTSLRSIDLIFHGQ